MSVEIVEKKFNIQKHLENFRFFEKHELSSNDSNIKTKIDYLKIAGQKYPRFTREYWTSRQRQANSIHEIAYRACFKPQLPRFFIDLVTKKADLVYDPFCGRGTTSIEAALLGRNIITNDINPLSKILTYPRLLIPTNLDLERRLFHIPVNQNAKAEIDLSMFYHPKTEAEIVSLKCYLQERKKRGKEDELDLWIRMVATNRLTGHSPGFFSVYTLPPNQAISPERQRKINVKRKQKPEYRDIKKNILRKSVTLTADINEASRKLLGEIGKKAKFLTSDARHTKEIQDETVSLTVTSPPFLNVVQYAHDNWLRCWFNRIDPNEIEKKITMVKNVSEWSDVMADVFKELYRITKRGGWVAFEVGEVRGGVVKLDECIVPLGVDAGFECEGILINQQTFTKTANIWGIKNNKKGTNTNRIVIFYKG